MVQLIKQAALEAVENSKPSGLYFGTVSSVSPLEINLEQKLMLNSSDLVLTSLVSTFDVDMTVNNQTNTYTVKLELTEGEKVMLLRVQDGQKYIVLDRVR